jgi:cytochrome c oxidase assembly protein subunit 15
MADARTDPIRTRAVRTWLYVVAALMVITLIVGGATRLTESGLSITEWRPVTGVLPPLSAQEWQVEFDKYRAIPQYQQLNKGMSLDAFKTIYWWEWSHRFLARTVGAVFLLPFLFFLWRGWIEPKLKWRLWGLFAAGGALGAVGWWMVSSGLADRVSVSPYRLGFHLTLACTIYAAIVWTARQMDTTAPVLVPRRIQRTAVALVALVLFQIYLGALVAGLDAGLSFNTWPLMDGMLIPSAERLWFETPAWRNLFENNLTVQFNHRMVAYLVWLLSIAHAFDVMRSLRDRHVSTGALMLAAVITLQAGLGIVTLLYLAPLGLALAHQAMAILVLTVGVVHVARLTTGRRNVGIAETPIMAAGPAR